MAIPLALAIGAGIGLAKAELIDRKKEERDRRLAAETQRLSPWTGLQAGSIEEADPLGSALAFGATGAQIGSAMSKPGGATAADIAGPAQQTMVDPAPRGTMAKMPEPSVTGNTPMTGNMWDMALASQYGYNDPIDPLDVYEWPNKTNKNNKLRGSNPWS